MPDRDTTNSESWWARHRNHVNYILRMVIALGTAEWALKRLGWLFGWTSEPVQGRLGQVFDALVVLAAGVFAGFHAIRHITRKNDERQAMLDRFHDKAVKAREAGKHHA
jgi:hypothetical protein